MKYNYFDEPERLHFYKEGKDENILIKSKYCWLGKVLIWVRYNDSNDTIEIKAAEAYFTDILCFLNTEAEELLIKQIKEESS